MVDLLRVLIVAHQLADAEQMVAGMRDSGFDPEWQTAANIEAFGMALNPNLDLVLVDDNEWGLANGALQVLEQSGLDVPLVISVDGKREAEACEWIARGADGYVVTGRSQGLRSCLPRTQETNLLSRKRARNEDESHLRDLEATYLASVARILSQPVSLSARTSAFLEEISRIAHGDSATLRVADQDKNMHLIARVGGEMRERPGVQHSTQGLSAVAFQSGKVVVTSDYPSHPAAEPLAVDQGTKSVVSLPVSADGEILGTVTVVSKKPGYFTPELVSLLTTLVGGAGILLENVQLADHLRSSAEEIILVDQVATAITSTLDIGQIFAKFAGEVRKLVDFDHSAINIIDRDPRVLLALHFVWPDSVDTSPPLTLALEGTQTETAILTGRTIIQDDLSKLPGFSTDGFFNELGLRSSILTPLAYNDQIIGSMSLASNRPGAFGAREQRIIERLASQIAPAVENARLYEEAVSRTVQLECLLKFTEILGQTRPFEEKVSQVLEQLVEVAEGYSAHFRVPDATGEQLILTASAGAPDDLHISRPKSLGVGSLIYDAYQQGRPIIVDDYQNHPKALPVLADKGDVSSVFLPIGSGERPAAMVVVDSKELGHFTPDRVRLLTALGEGLGTLLENGRLSEELRSSTEEIAMVDQIASIMTSTLDIDDIYDRFAVELRKLVDFDRAVVVMVDRQTNSYTIKHTWGLDVPSLQAGRSRPLEGSFLDRALRSGDWSISEALAPTPDTPVHSYLLDAGLRSHMLAPLVSNDEVIGAIAVMSAHIDTFGPRQQAILERLASQIAPAIQNAQLYREAQQRTREIERLNGLTNRILASNPSALAVLRGTSRKVVTVNQAFLQAFGLKREEIEGKPISQAVDWNGLQELIQRSLSSPMGEGQNELRYLTADGDERWFLVSAVPLMAEDESDDEDDALLVLNDTTEQKRQKDRLQEHSRLASVGQLAAGVAHEINNPLAAIHGISELLQMEELPSPLSEDIRRIQQASERAAKVVQNLLAFARNHEPEKRYMDVASIVDSATALKANGFRLNNIQVTTHHSGRVPRTMADEHQLIQVMLNILTNAEQSILACQGGGNITTSTRLIKGMIRITISDDGLGIPTANLHSIFDPFFSTKEVGVGTGLGLSICYGIVREHGGELWAESGPEGGAKFHIELPVLPEECTTEAQDANPSSKLAPNRRILVVDDEPLVREILYRGLSADGHNVSVASNGEEAWELMKGDELDVIITDLRMPGIGGRELYQMANETSSDLAKKIVFITGDTASAKDGDFLSSMGNRVLHKPFGMDAVRLLIRAVLGD